MTHTARILVVPATRNDETKLTVIISGPQSNDSARLIKVLAHLLSDGDEWDGPIPNAELIVQREIEVDA